MKNLLSTVRGWVVVGVVLGSGGAWGQRGMETQPYTTTDNCTGFKYPSPVPRKSINWSGDCKNGKLNAIGVLSYEIQSPIDNLWRQIVAIGYMNEGVRAGMFIQASCIENNKPDCLSLTAIDPAGTPYVIDFTRDTQKRPKYFSSTNVTAMVDTMREFESFIKGAPTANTAELLTLMKAWSAAPDMSLDRFKNFRPNASVGTAIKADDPKVFGRSARGG